MVVEESQVSTTERPWNCSIDSLLNGDDAAVSDDRVELERITAVCFFCHLPTSAPLTQYLRSLNNLATRALFHVDAQDPITSFRNTIYARFLLTARVDIY